MKITSSKLSAVSPPTWKRYPGVSLLYDAPGSAAVSGLAPLETLGPAGPEGVLYDRLRDVAEALVGQARAAGAELCLVPPSTYHVTLCDGVNEGSRAHVPEGRREEVARTLDELPDSLLWANGVMRLLRDPEIRWSVWTDPVTFRVQGLSVWGHALTARLVPAGTPSQAAMSRHAKARTELVERLRVQVGAETQAWRPHVTLAYFANEDHAAHARTALLPRWQELARERTAQASVTFRSASVYGFTDMVSYWRLGS